MPLQYSTFPKITNERTTVLAFRDSPSETIELYARYGYDTGAGRRIARAQPVVFEPSLEGVKVPPMLRLSREEAQELMQSLLDCGIQPAHTVDKSATLENELKARHAAALERHLEDMRKLVFSKDGAPANVRRLDPEVYDAITQLSEVEFVRWLDRLREARRAAGNSDVTQVIHGILKTREWTTDELEQIIGRIHRDPATPPDRRDYKNDPDPITKTEEAIRKEFFDPERGTTPPAASWWQRVKTKCQNWTWGKPSS